MEVGLLSELYAGDELVAAQFGLRCDPVLAGWHLTYSAALPKYSPGLIPVLHLARAAAASGIHRINMGRGAAEYKAMFSSRDLFVAEGQVVRRSSGRGTALGPVRIGAWASSVRQRASALVPAGYGLGAHFTLREGERRP